MNKFNDVQQFLAKHESKSEIQMNQRRLLPSDEILKLRSEHPGIPEDYLEYLTEIGAGSFRECQYVIYDGLVEAGDIFGSVTAAILSKRVLCFGDNFSGDPGGFLPDENWAVVEIWHDSLDVYETNNSFGAFIREKMLMDENGNDLHVK